MEIVFFVALPEEALCVTSSDDLPGDPAAEPMPTRGPEGLIELAAALGWVGRSPLRTLRDATCRSYPVWTFDDAICERLRTLNEDGLDLAAERWTPHPETDAHERSECLEQLRESVASRADGARLYALLEERAC